MFLNVIIPRLFKQKNFLFTSLSIKTKIYDTSIDFKY